MRGHYRFFGRSTHTVLISQRLLQILNQRLPVINIYRRPFNRLQVGCVYYCPVLDQLYNPGSKLLPLS